MTTEPLFDPANRNKPSGSVPFIKADFSMLYGVGIALLAFGGCCLGGGLAKGWVPAPGLVEFGVGLTSLGGFWFILACTLSMIRVPMSK
jgi:hypothetical protein